MSDELKLPWRLDKLDGYSTSQGPTFDGGMFYGGGTTRERSIAVRVLEPQGRPATVELDLTEKKHHGCTVTLNPEQARQAAAALVAAAERAEASMAHWREVLDKQRTELAALTLRDLTGRAGMAEEPRP